MTVGSKDLRFGFDVDAIRDRYREERDKRLRPDGDDQYTELSGKFLHYNEDDPYAAPLARDPVERDVDVAIIGGGFSGLLAGARLQEVGIQDLCIVEAGGDFGGTWYWNRYPGAQCDVESYSYLPLLEETGFVPENRYSFTDEIFEYCQLIGRRFGLYDRTYFQTRARSLEWDEGLKRWRLRTSRGDDIRARFVINGLGTASRAKLPGIPGIEDFEGHSFHTSRWDYEYTGGGVNSPLTRLADKRVAIIGTGATAIQCIPRVAWAARHLHVFQRTPSTLGFRNNKETDVDWYRSQAPGWQDERRRAFADMLQGVPVADDLAETFDNRVNKNSQALRDLIAREAPKTPRETAFLVEVADHQIMNGIRQRVDDEVRDAATAEALKPWYRRMCKRPTFNDEFLACFNQDNVTLVDVSDAKGVERITPTGVVANGVEYEVDCIIYASGFEITSDFKRRMGFEIKGRGGKSLFDHWRGGLGSMKTLHGFSTRGFPNWFYIGVSQNAVGFNMTQMFDEQARHIAYVIAETQKRQGLTVEPSEAAQDAWVQEIRDTAVDATKFQMDCTPGYYNNEGNPGGGMTSGAYQGGINRFNEILSAWRSAGDLAGLEISRAE